MARIPIYTQQSVASAGPGLPQAGAAAFGGAIAGALNDVGNEVAAYEDRQRRREEEAAVTDVSVKVAEADAHWPKILREREGAAAPGAPGHTDAIIKDFDAYQAEVLGGIGNMKARAYAQKSLAALRADVVEQAQAFEARQRAAQQVGNFARTVDLNRNTIQDDPAKFGPLYAKSMAMVAALTLPPDAKAKLAADTQDGLASSAVIGEISRDPDAALDKLKKGEWNQYLTPEAKIKLTNQAEAEIAQRAALARRAQAEQRVELGNRLEDFKANLDAGLPVDPEEIGRAAAAARAINRPELARAIDTMGRRNDLTARLNVLPPVELQNQINHLSGTIAAGQATAEQLRDRETAEGVLRAMTSALAQDPLSWAAKVGVARAPALDFSDEASFAARVKTGDGVAEYYRTPPVYLTNEEATRLAGQIAVASADGKMDFARRLSAGFGPRAASRVFAQVAPKEPLFAHAGGLAMLGPDQALSARQIFAGEELMKAGTAVVKDGAGLGGQALALQPQARGAIVQAAAAIYTAEAARQGLTKDDFDDDLWKQSLNRAAGASVGADGKTRGGFHTPGSAGFAGFGRRNVHPILLPADMTGEEFDDLVYSLTPQKAAAAGPSGKAPIYENGDPVLIDPTRPGYLWDAGDGKYLISTDAAGLDLWGDGGGGVYVLDVRKLRGAKP
ncbi:MAG: hypothetical protein DCC73_11375 [Proteobacteria bacterium]|nr:MAG: hypothetical protein DCC73_11375 [Pseudomonadota bacterium]